MTDPEAEREGRRKEFVDTAERMIRERGVSALSARTLAREMGCSPALVYRYFEDFDELVLRANSRFIARLDAVLAGTAVNAASVEERYVALSLAYLRFGLSNRNQWHALFEHRMSGGAPIPDWHLEEHLNLFRHIAGPLAELAPSLGEGQRLVLARTIYSAVHGIVSIGTENRLGEVSVCEVEAQLVLFVRTLVRGLSQPGVLAGQ